MTDDLTKKLEKILPKFYLEGSRNPNGYGEAMDLAIKDINKAYLADGWIKGIKLSIDNAWRNCIVCGNPVSDQHVHSIDMMSGQEWFTKFEKELSSFTADHDQPMKEEALLVAKKISGLIS